MSVGFWDFVAKNDIVSRTSGLVSLATHIMVIINDRYLILSWDRPRCDDAGDDAVGKFSGRKSAIIRLVKPF